jgi:hypothetical protein
MGGEGSAFSAFRSAAPQAALLREFKCSAGLQPGFFSCPCLYPGHSEPSEESLFGFLHPRLASGAFGLVNGTGEIFSQTKNWEYVASNIP